MTQEHISPDLTTMTDNCFAYVKLHMSYVTGPPRPTEDKFVVDNALHYLVLGCEEAFQDLVKSELFDIRPLKDVLEWVKRQVMLADQEARDRELRLRDCIHAFERTGHYP